jgi:DNA-binding transcriptional LysR family regulator
MAVAGAPDLNALLLFAAVAEQGSFTAAAAQLGVAKAKVSLVVGRLEQQLGQTLFARTTRRVTLTEAGQELYRQCVPPVRAVQDAMAQFGAGELTGVLRVAAPIEYAGQNLAPALAAFATHHPRLDIDLRTSERVVDMLKEGIDVALRLGWLRDSSLRALRLGEFEQFVVASPEYLKRAPAIRHPRDLAQHQWVTLTLLATPLTWRFTSARGQVRTVRVAGRIRTDSGAALRGLLQAGSGVSVLDEFSAAAPLRSGSLVRVLPGWSLAKGGVHAVYPPGRHVPAKVRAFVDFYREWLANSAGA